MKDPRLRALLAALLALAAIVGGVQLTDDDGDGRSDHVKIPLPGATPDVRADRDQEREPGEAAPTLAPDGHEDLRDETPLAPGLENGPAQAKPNVRPPGLPKPQPPAGAQSYSCKRDPVRNHSARNGPVLMFVLHIAVANPGALDAIQRLFDTPSFGASSTLGLELNGRCEQWLAFDRKPWTQGAFNSASESVEIITRLIPRQAWLSSAIFRRGILAAIVRDRLRARGLPIRLVDPVGCTPVAGYTDHDRLECGNSHVDVGDGFPWDVFAVQVKRGTAAAYRPLPARYVTDCRGLAKLRRSADRRRRAGKSPLLTAGQHEQRRAMRRRFEPPESRDVRCNERTGKAARS